MILCTIRMNGNSCVPKSSIQLSLKARKPCQTQRQNVVEVPKRYLRLLHWTQNCVELIGLDNETLLSQIIYFGWYDGTKHPINCVSIPDQAGITKPSVRCFCSKMSKTRFQVFYSKMSKTASHLWEVNLIRAYRVNKNEVAKLDPMQWQTTRSLFSWKKCGLEKGVSKMFHRFAGEKGNKKAPALRVQGRSFFDRFVCVQSQARL